MVKNFAHAVKIQKRRVAGGKQGIANAVMRYLKKNNNNDDELRRQMRSLPQE